MRDHIHYRDYIPAESDKLFMAQMLPDEGLDIWLGQFPLATAKYTSPLQCALFTSQSASTVITHAQTIANITEAAFTNYARQTLAAATWGALAERPTNLGRQTTYPQVTYPTVGATGATVNGFYIANNGFTAVIGQANFDDGLAVVLATNDVIKVTPTIALLH
jgi:hypothetical protein